MQLALREAWDRQVERISAALPDDLKAMPDLVAAYDMPAETAALAPIIQGHMQRLAEIGAWDVLALWNPESDGWGPEMIEAWIARAAETNAARWSTAVHDGLIEAVRDTENMGDRLRAFLASNALIIALGVAFATEALSFGSHDAAVKSGLGTKTWRTTSKSPRRSHAALNGETVRIDDIFSNGLRWPGDHFGTAADNANCSCRLDYGRGDL